VEEESDEVVRLPQSTANDDLSELKNMAGLQSLSLLSPESVSDEGLAHLAPLKLQRLELHHARQVTNAGMVQV
jgi:hypothetical protein